MSFRPSNIAPGAILLAAWGWWTYHVVRAITTAGGLGAHWAERAFLGKTVFVIWDWITLCVAAALLAVAGAALYALVHAIVDAVKGAARSDQPR